MKMMLLALNASYIHSNLALRYLHETAKEKGFLSVEFAEYTINHRLPVVIDEVYRKSPDVLLLSSYIWNIEQMLSLASEYKKISPQTLMFAGGPEVSYNTASLLRAQPALAGILRGEGEIAFVELLEFLEGKRKIEAVSALSYRLPEGEIVENPLPPPLSLDLLPFPYPDLEKMKNRILYFETIRGCPFRCTYCLSSLTGGVRYLSPELAFPRLQRFLDAKVPQVKFVDRTFNCSKTHAMAIWKYLAAHDNGITNFHFELTAHLLDEEMLSFLSTLRPGLFQFEIGVQSTNPETILQIKRTTDTPRLLSICRALDRPKNIHLHLDLIAGLPYENLESFGRSFDEVMAVRPQQMQLGFLKVLKGSLMAQSAPEYGLVSSDKAPYQVIRTHWLNYHELLLLKDMAEMVETYYNSGRFTQMLEYIFARESSLFAFFLDFGQAYVAQGFHLLPQREEMRYTILKDFFLTRSPKNKSLLPRFRELCLEDIAHHGKLKKLPDWVSPLHPHHLKKIG